MANRRYNFRIYPNKNQKNIIAKTFGCSRFVYNYFLQKITRQYHNSEHMLSYCQSTKELAQLKMIEEYAFLREVDSISLQQSLKFLNLAFQNYFNNKNVGYPKYKSKKAYSQSYTTRCVNNNIRIEDGRVRLPVVGNIKIKLHRTIPKDYVIKMATVELRSSGKYYVSILTEYNVSAKEKTLFDETNTVGLDFSMRFLFVDSRGVSPDYECFYKETEKRLEKEQRKLSHMQKHSSNYEKQRIKVARIHEKIYNQRKDLQHKLSRQIANDWDAVCVEALNLKEMKECEMPFGKSLEDNSWGNFLCLLKYKMEEGGKKLIEVDRYFPSTQQCCTCKNINTRVKDLAVRSWVCPHCGVQNDRDINAAINIRNEGLRLLKT